ncbi:protein eva-1 homolog A [Kryptolebias marmoratus]|uniref:Protein eva-1 homolog A-like n=1 Tax=Kryptolebias marmoratus TaxID=37003 RepID=A0A3Q3BAL1_KRYMA|nr:protein eva-1 homolog A [Kryptolebias marmoratus]XP_017274245.1 protein eva-1 homolog A [Kryptolebias marmoratus]XP_037835962.1 protein eva-1 homolog A [Kryptolebias marmoratus]
MSTSTTGSPNMEVKVVSQEMALLSNIMAAYTFIADQPERTALVFLGGVSVGLLVTLCAIVFQIHCRADCHYGNTNDLQHRHKVRHHGRQHICAQQRPSDSNADPSAAVVVASGGTGASGANEPEDWDDTTDLSAQRRRRFERALLHANMFTSSEELDRAQRLEERERILREIWMNGQPDISTVTQSLNRYY